MTFSNFSESQLCAVYVTDAAQSLVSVERARERLAHLPFHRVAGRDDVPESARNRRNVVVDAPRGRVVSRCPGSRGQECCNYLTVDLYIGCSIGCSYCIMQSYLNYAPLVVQADPYPAVQEIRRLAEQNADRMVRVGSGEVGDSLLLDPAFRLSEEIICAVADLPNVRFESKTKTDFVDHLLSIPAKGGAVIGFSVNPEPIVRAEEGTAAPTADRLRAASRALEAGFRVAFHFDPVIRSGARTPEDALRAYADLADQIARLCANVPDRIAWVSLGTVRFTPGLRSRIADRPYLYDEFVPCPDGKYRYIQRERVRIYTDLYQRLRRWADIPVYLCMESRAVWRRVTGSLPSQIPGLRDIFTPVTW